MRPSAHTSEAGSATPRVSDAARREADLLPRLRAGDGDACRDLVELHGPRMLAAARRLLRNEDDAQDAVQEAFLCAFKSMASFDGRSSLGTWLHRIVLNASLMGLRRKKGRAHEDIDELLPTFTENGCFAASQERWPEAPEDPLQREELHQVVHAAIASLPERFRDVILLRDVEGLSNERLADALGVSVNAAKIRVHRARQALRALLAPRMESLQS